MGLSHFEAARLIQWGQTRARVVAPMPPRDPVLAQWFGGYGDSVVGGIVTPDTAMQVATVYSCVRVLSETLAMLPLLLYRRGDGDSKDKATGHYLYKILHDRPNPWQTSFEFREMMMAHVVLRGNAFARIVSNGLQGVDSLIPLNPDRVVVQLGPDNKRVYLYQPPSGQTETILQSEMFHLPGLSFDGIKGITPISYHREAIGLAMKTEEHGARLFASGTQVGGVLQHPGSLKDDSHKRLKESLKQYQGAGNAHKIMVLEEGMTFNKIGMTSNDAQFLETRRFQSEEIARIFRVPPHKIGILDKATFSNIEHQSLEFVTDTMLPWIRRWEQAIGRDLISQNNLFAEFNVDGLLRGDIETRYKAYAIGRTNGWLSVNEIRAKENMNPLNDTDGGNNYLVPLNMQPAGQPQEPAQNAA